MLQPGARFAHRYEVEALLGEGGLGVAYRTRDRSSGLRVCLKLLQRRELASVLRAEFEALRGLHHPNLVRVRDFGAALLGDRMVPYFTSDLVVGEPLDRAAFGRTYPELRQMCGGLLRALNVLHRAGIRHGDVKPDNVLVAGSGHATLIDLSCAAELGRSSPDISGTPGFVAPELLRGERADERADLFSVGRMLAAILPSVSDVPDSVRALVRRLAADRPEDRPLAAAEALEALELPIETGGARLHDVRELLGRSGLQSTIAAAIDSVRQGAKGTRIISLVGEPGSGKSRALREVSWMCQLAMPTVEGHARAPDGMRTALANAANCDELPSSALAALMARDQILALGQPLALLIDDVDRAGDDQRSMIEAFARLLTPHDPILLITTRSRAADAAPNVVGEVVTLEPLHRDDVHAWVTKASFEPATAAVFAASHGHPADVAACLDALAAGVPSAELGVALAAAHSELAPGVELPAALRVPLAMLALSTSPIDIADLEPALLGNAPSDLLATGLVRRVDAGYELLRPGLAAAVQERVDATTLRSCHLALAERAAKRCDEPSVEAQSHASAERTLHLALAGRERAAFDLFGASAALIERAPRFWLPTVRALTAATALDGQSALAFARTLSRAGEPKRAREIVRDGVSGARLCDVAEGALLDAECSIELGDANEARALLEALELPSGAARSARAALLARAQVRLGAHADALALARAALPSCDQAETRADLLECAGVAALYTGDLERARRDLSEAEALLEERAPARRRVRAASYRAILAFREGDLDAARAGYADALALAERHAVADQIARCALNLGTANHQRGELGEALAMYERGERIATALDQADLLLILSFNVAKLHADAGALDRAEAKALTVVRAAQTSASGFFIAAAESVLGDVAFARGQLPRAKEQFAKARSGFLHEAAQREVAEEDLELARVALFSGDRHEAEERLASARALGIDEAADLRVRAALISATFALEDGDAGAARVELARAIADAGTAHLPELEARALVLLADVAQRLGSSAQAAEHRARAHAIWTRMTAGFNGPALEAFFLRPERRALAESAPAAVEASSSRQRTLERLVSAFRKLNASVDTAAVLQMAMDEAIELTGAERGFLVLSHGDESELEIAVARNVDRASLGEGHLRFSRSIAERAIRSAEPVLTVDAQSDDRFRTNVSVHAMRLRSVIAVPIRSPDGVLGALYLDNRYQRARFGAGDTDLLLAFADQVAIALRNARLVEALTLRGSELVREGEKLREELEKTQAALEHRFDYSEIVGKSAALRKVLAVLDRVIDSPLSVLVTGESGTGKELVARAIHFASQRKAGPFIGINCAALPPTLLESELFGHARGAFTGADRDRIGLVVAAKGGTLFLDELGEMPLDVQAKLLRVLQEREVRPVGSSQTVPVDFRLVCATNRDLRAEVAAGRFREDLFYRVSVVDVRVPPLRERLEDLPDLVVHFVARCAREMARPEPRVTPGVLRKLERYTFPGNIRELENLITKAVVLAEGSELRAVDIELPRSARLSAKKGAGNERETLLRALESSNYSAVRAAQDLGLPRATFYRKLKACGLERPVRSRPARPGR